jgi:predicted membrane-bound mannosyltransferase
MVLLAAIYSLLPYKTPWCLLNFWQPCLLLAGVGAAGMLRGTRQRTAWGVIFALLLAGSAHLGWQAWKLAVPLAADQRNPYVYAQTSQDLRRLVTMVNTIAKAANPDTSLSVKVIAPDDDYWPLPYYFRGLPQTGWYRQMPADPQASMMVVSAQLDVGLDKNGTHLMVGYFQLRPSVFLEFYVELNLWKAYLAGRPRPPAE